MSVASDIFLCNSVWFEYDGVQFLLLFCRAVILICLWVVVGSGFIFAVYNDI